MTQNITSQLQQDSAIISTHELNDSDGHLYAHNTDMNSYELMWTVVNMPFWLTSALDTSTLRYSLLYETKMHWEDGQVQMNLWTYGFNFLNNTERNTSTTNNNKNDCHCIITKYQSKQILQLFSELDSHFCEPVFFSVFLLTWCQVEFSVWSGCSDSCQVFTLSVQRRV